MRLPALRLAFLRGLIAAGTTTTVLADWLLGTVLLLPGDLPEAEREEICDIVALFIARPMHVAARPRDLPAGHICIVTEPVERDIAPVDDGVVIATRAIEAGRRRLGLSRELRRLRDTVLQAIVKHASGNRLEDIAAWAQEVADSPSTALRFVSAAHRELLAQPFATNAELATEGLAEVLGWLLRGVEPRVAEWVLARAVPSSNPGKLVSLEAALLGETAALQRALAAGLVEHLPERPGDPEDLLDLRRPIALLGQLGDLSAPVELSVIAGALRMRLDPLAHRVFDRALVGRPKPLRLDPPLVRPDFVGREEVLARLRALFESTREIRTAVLHGPAGIGKSAVAAALCERLSHRFEPVWLTFVGGPEAAWQRVADGIGVDTQARAGESIVGRTPTWLGRVFRAIAKRDALLVVDDVDGMPESELSAWLPGGAGTCVVLVLSRQPQPVLQREHDAIAVSLGALSDADARLLLSLKVPAMVEVIRRGEADAFLGHLGGHPLAIGVVSGLLEKRSVAEVTEMLERGPRASDVLAGTVLEGLDVDARTVVDALVVAARTGAPRALVGEMVKVEDVGSTLQRLANEGLVELGLRMVRLHGIVQFIAEPAMGEDRRRRLEVLHAHAVGTVMEAARARRDGEGQDEIYVNAMLALQRMTERCRADERELAATLEYLAYQLAEYPRGSRAASLSAAIDGWRAVLGVWTRASDPERWARVQANLGNKLGELHTGDRAANLKGAIAACEAALTVRTRDADPKRWAGIQNNLGKALATLNGPENLRRAIKTYEAALTVFTEQTNPENWAAVQNNLGVALLRLLDGDQAENQRRAIEAFRAALRVYARDAYPDRWARVQNNLGDAPLDLAEGDPAANLRGALDAYEAALTVFTPQTHPENWAMVQNNLGYALGKLSDEDQDENLRRAIDAYRAALTVFTMAEFPRDWARAQRKLGSALLKLRGGDRRQNLNRAIDALRASLTVNTLEDFPDEHAHTQALLADAHRELASLAPPSPP